MHVLVDLMAQRQRELLLHHRLRRADALVLFFVFFVAAQKRGKLGADPLHEVAEEEQEALRFLLREKTERHHMVRVFFLSLRGQVPSAVQLEEEEKAGRLDSEELRITEFQKNGLPRECFARRGGESARSSASASTRFRAWE